MKQNAKKNVPLVKQNVIDKELIRRERRDGGEGEERGLRKGVESRIKIERKETEVRISRETSTLASACCSASSRH